MISSICRRCLRSAEIDQLDGQILTDKNILRTDISVNHARLVNNCKCVQHRQTDMEDMIRIQPSSMLPNVLFQRTAMQILHDHIGSIIFLQII